MFWFAYLYQALGFCATLCSVLKGLLQRSTDSVSTNGGSGKIRKKKAKDVAEVMYIIYIFIKTKSFGEKKGLLILK